MKINEPKLNPIPLIWKVDRKQKTMDCFYPKEDGFMTNVCKENCWNSECVESLNDFGYSYFTTYERAKAYLDTL